MPSNLLCTVTKGIRQTATYLFIALKMSTTTVYETEVSTFCFPLHQPWKLNYKYSDFYFWDKSLFDRAMLLHKVRGSLLKIFGRSDKKKKKSERLQLFWIGTAANLYFLVSRSLFYSYLQQWFHDSDFVLLHAFMFLFCSHHLSLRLWIE